jgi:hypothetical protein
MLGIKAAADTSLCLALPRALPGRPPAEDRGSSAGSLLSRLLSKCTWACVLCRPSPDLPFHFVGFLGWSMLALALDPSSVLYLQHKLCSYLDALIYSSRCSWAGFALRGRGGLNESHDAPRKAHAAMPDGLVVRSMPVIAGSNKSAAPGT